MTKQELKQKQTLLKNEFFKWYNKQSEYDSLIQSTEWHNCQNEMDRITAEANEILQQLFEMGCYE